MLEQKIISIESTSSICAVALSEGERIIGEYVSYDKNQHDRLLAEFVKRLIEDHDLKIENIDAVAVSAGPGSFTGLRIGASVAKGLSFGNSPKLISVPTLDALAFAGIAETKKQKMNKIIATVPSHKNILYFREYDLELNPLTEVEITTIEEIETKEFTNALVCGPAAEYFSESIINERLNQLDVKKIARLANKLYQKNKFTNASEFKPLYIQEFTPKMRQKKLDI
jgi:tRNA threonylcarbamoyladenosine biosynthesis protein TsaB